MFENQRNFSLFIDIFFIGPLLLLLLVVAVVLQHILNIFQKKKKKMNTTDNMNEKEIKLKKKKKKKKKRHTQGDEIFFSVSKLCSLIFGKIRRDGFVYFRYSS